MSILNLPIFVVRKTKEDSKGLKAKEHPRSLKTRNESQRKNDEF